MSERVESVKKLAEKAAKMAQQAMSDKPPAPVELGGIADKLPRPGTLISPPPMSASLALGPTPDTASGSKG